MVILIPLYSEIGAAMALVVGSIIFYSSSTIICHFEFSLSYPVRFLAKILISCTPMLIYLPFSVQIERSIPGAIVYMGLVTLAFWGIFKLQGGINQEERSFLARVNLPMKGLLLKILD